LPTILRWILYPIVVLIGAVLFALALGALAIIYAYPQLPSLEVLESMSFRATILGFAFLSLAILVGFIWLPRAFESFSYADPKLLVTVSIWLLYGIGFSARTIGRWQGRRVVILALCGFAIVFLSMTVVNVFFSGFHNFY